MFPTLFPFSRAHLLHRSRTSLVMTGMGSAEMPSAADTGRLAGWLPLCCLWSGLAGEPGEHPVLWLSV